jgi:DNA-binding IclR family transcriptional regulator
MPRKPSTPSVADHEPAPGGSAAVDKALSLLRLFGQREGALTLTELAERASLYKSTALRLLASLEHGGLVRRQADGRYGLGPEAARLGAAYTRFFSFGPLVMPVLKELVERTRESAAFHVRSGASRLCLFRVDSPQVVRDHIRVGDTMPLERGAGGRVLLAFDGARGALYDRIRQDGHAVLRADRTPDLAGISAPVFDATGAVVGAITLTMPVHRLRDEQLAPVVEAAAQLSALLGAPAATPGAAGRTTAAPARRRSGSTSVA